ncbi:transglutaminase domain-containing protein [Aquimarina sp. RZ0]|uniref:transglutaminase domain-containing protein n=1 Tax=Aquimarina sp. RZ0 TaxID=2607730 RepID=UPI0011F0C63F|nr:transglutaminase domain-containing protein [Aquimarina sp. RZ0]KAA1241006.1 hypothetical protein F0000_26810 [Aquimarina sp. RZ0]
MSKPQIEKSDLVNYVSKNINNKKQIAEFFYYWMSLNIEYDYDLLKKIRSKRLSKLEQDQSSNTDYIFKEKKAVCIGYSTLFQEFLSAFDIESEIIVGYAKTEENPTLELEVDTDFLHAWNALKINNNWILVDVTWAKQFEGAITDFYFDIDPERNILTHYPNDSKWQLLKNPISISDFNKLPYIHSFYFQTGFPKTPIITSDSKYYYFEFKNNPNKNWLVKLTYSLDNLNYKSVFPEYIKNKDGFTYKFSKERVPNNSIIRMDLTDFNEEKQMMIPYEKVAFFNL